MNELVGQESGERTTTPLGGRGREGGGFLFVADGFCRRLGGWWCCYYYRVTVSPAGSDSKGSTDVTPTGPRTLMEGLVAIGGPEGPKKVGGAERPGGQLVPASLISFLSYPSHLPYLPAHTYNLVRHDKVVEGIGELPRRSSRVCAREAGRRK